MQGSDDALSRVGAHEGEAEERRGSGLAAAAVTSAPAGTASPPSGGGTPAPRTPSSPSPPFFYTGSGSTSAPGPDGSADGSTPPPLTTFLTSPSLLRTDVGAGSAGRGERPCGAAAPLDEIASLLPAYEAEGLLGLAGAMVPLLPPNFLLRNWGMYWRRALLHRSSAKPTHDGGHFFIGIGLLSTVTSRTEPRLYDSAARYSSGSFPCPLPIHSFTQPVTHSARIYSFNQTLQVVVENAPRALQPAIVRLCVQSLSAGWTVDVTHLASLQPSTPGSTPSPSKATPSASRRSSADGLETAAGASSSSTAASSASATATAPTRTLHSAGQLHSAPTADIEASPAPPRAAWAEASPATAAESISAPAFSGGAASPVASPLCVSPLSAPQRPWQFREGRLLALELVYAGGHFTWWLGEAGLVAWRGGLMVSHVSGTSSCCRSIRAR